jgi:type IV fimbrial biogenesis protein FimT
VPDADTISITCLNDRDPGRTSRGGSSAASFAQADLVKVANMNRRSHISGFTLLELVVVMTIAATLMAVAIPSFRYVSTNNRMSGEANALLGDMQYARVEAIKEGQPVSICVANAALGNCLTGTPPWANGWIVFSDSDGDGVLAAPTDIVRKQISFTSSLSQDTFTSPVPVVTFNREGFAAGLTTTPTAFTLHDPTGNTKFTRCVAVYPTGSLSVIPYDGANCK